MPGIGTRSQVVIPNERTLSPPGLLPPWGSLVLHRVVPTRRPSPPGLLDDLRTTEKQTRIPPEPASRDASIQRLPHPARLARSILAPPNPSSRIPSPRRDNQLLELSPNSLATATARRNTGHGPGGERSRTHPARRLAPPHRIPRKRTSVTPRPLESQDAPRLSPPRLSRPSRPRNHSTFQIPRLAPRNSKDTKVPRPAVTPALRGLDGR